MRPPAPWAILEIDLDRPVPGLGLPDGANAVLLIFRRRGKVLGTRFLLPDNLPLTALEISAIAAKATSPSVAALLASGGMPVPAPTPGSTDFTAANLCGSDGSILERLDEIIAARSARRVCLSASVVICTRHRPGELAGCLDAVAAADSIGNKILVVDNGPDDETRAVAGRFPGVHYIAEPLPGLSRARNAGLRAATGDVVAFIDDDVRPEPGWIRPLLQAFASEEVAVVCGLVLPHELATDAQIGFECDLGFGTKGLRPLVYDASYANAWSRGVPVWRIGAGANMAVRRRTALDIGGFDERLGPGVAGGCGDDSEFWRRVLTAGHIIIYEPFSIVRHRHRSSREALEAQTRGYAEGHVAALFAQYAVVRDRGDLLRAFIDMPGEILGRAVKAPFQWLRGKPDRLLWHWTRGFLAGLARVGLAVAPREQVPHRGAAE